MASEYSEAEGELLAQRWLSFVTKRDNGLKALSKHFHCSENDTKDEQDTQQRALKPAFHAKCPTCEATQGGGTSSSGSGR